MISTKTAREIIELSKPYDVRNIDEDTRKKYASVIQRKKDWELPHLSTWNYDPCRKHRNGWEDVVVNPETGEEETVTILHRPNPKCRQCGIRFAKHQKVGIAWLYMQKNALLADSMGLGKALANSEPVLTPTGWTNISDLQPLDSVVGSDGQPHIVSGVYPQGEKDIYSVTFSDGSVVKATLDHLWEVNTPSLKYHGSPSLVMTTEEILNKGVKEKNGNRKWYIPLTSPVELGDGSALPVDPYLVGVILGDGGVKQSYATVLTTDHEIVDNCVLPEGVSTVMFDERTRDYYAEYRLNGIQPYLRELGISGRSWEKSVPRSYLWTSFENRLALFHGLVDSDGTPTVNGTAIEWGTTSPKLAEDMKFLIESFGGTFHVGTKIPTYSYKGEKKEGREFFRFVLKLPVGIQKFRLSRKQEKTVEYTKYSPTRSIESIEFSHREEATCIKVTAPDSLFLTRNFVLTHNTIQAGGLLAMMLETGELGTDSSAKGRAILVPRAPALHQWYGELSRLVPSMNLAIAEGDKKKRTELYLQPWDVLIIGPEMLRNDFDLLQRFKLSLMLTDDVDALRNPETETSYVCDRLGRKADRYVIMSGTPLQKRLPELHAVLDGIAGTDVLGTLKNFIKRHVRMEYITSTDKNGREVTNSRVSGYRRLDEVKEKIKPFVLRRTADDVKDVSLPRIIPDDVFLDLYPTQRARYKELQQGVVKLLKEGSEKTKYTTALTKIHYGAAICAGLFTLGEPDGEGASVKLDWVLDKVSEGGDLGDEKVVIFANLKDTVRALQARLDSAGIGYVTVWGEETNKRARAAAQEQFWNDPQKRILIGTRAIEQSLNLQNARHLINIDTILNPARMEQLAGRVRRTGSAYKHVYVHNLLTRNTQEERYLPLLEREAALSAHIWEEGSELFSLINDPDEMLRLISGT